MNDDPRADALCFLTIAELSEKLRTREVSPVEVTRAVLDRCARRNDEMRVYITITAETALAQARQAEREIMVGDYRGPLHGVTVSLKDNIATKGIRTSCASMVDPDWLPDHDATVYTKLRAAGAILVGKANLQEYACSLHPAYPEPINPWHRERSPSGSSSGSAVGVAIGMSHGSIGTDTGGSGRQPANVNNVVGLKATYGRVSRCGVVPLSYSLDHVTMMTRSVADTALMLQATAGYDERDEGSSPEPVPGFSAKLGTSIRGLRIGRARGYSHEGLDPDVVQAIDTAFTVLRGLGAEVQDIELPLVRSSHPVHDAITDPEAAVVHYDNLRTRADGLGQTAIAMFDYGNMIPATAYIQAQRVRKLMRDRFRDVFRQVDVIVGPASPMRVAPPGGWAVTINGRTIDRRTPHREHTGLYNLTGMPAIVLPAGFSSEATPIGLQIAGPWFDEATVLQVAHAYEQATDWHTRRPPLA